ncbi:MAG TPA: ATP-dependent Clp protease adaptor ClpS [Planctomycetaceae bacterium]|nr:ATP-dependent Clp protease adaptor ClpS [Planctomycetaceae bacterium]
MSSEETVAVDTETQTTTRRASRPKRQPRYHVILWNDDDHSFEYVIRMMRKLFGYPLERGLQIAEEVHTKGRAICLTTTREHAELKRDQIHAFGPDRLVADCKGAMWATIEPVDE